MMKVNVFNLVIFFVFVIINNVIADPQSGPQNSPSVSLVNGGSFINFPSTPLNCDETNSFCRYPENSNLSVQCPQGKIDIHWAGNNNTFISYAKNVFAFYLSNQCNDTQHSTHSLQSGDTLIIDCNPLKRNGQPCLLDYNYHRMTTTVQPEFQCGPGLADCIIVEGTEGKLVQSPNKADTCDPTITFCSFPHTSQFTVQCEVGNVTVQFNGTHNTFQNLAQNSIVYWMSNKCTNSTNNLSTQDGDLLVVNCNPFYPCDLQFLIR